MMQSKNYLANTPMNQGSLHTALEAKVLTIEFGHPKGNSMPGALLANLACSINDAAKDPKVGAVILKSAGEGVFCSGASFDELLEVKTQQESELFFGGFAKVIIAIKNSPKPIVASIQGKAIGGGVGLIAACDYTIAIRKSAVRLSELALGFGPFIIGPVVERKIGKSSFQNLTLDTEWRDSAWCLQNGLFSKVVDSFSELQQFTKNIAMTLASSNPAALKSLKDIFWSDFPNLEALLSSRVQTTASLVLTEFVKSKVDEIHKAQKEKK
jgi:methylglutaconyl-CoA hydratase